MAILTSKIDVTYSGSDAVVDINGVTMQVYFAFPDGYLDYNCAECDAICCKGFGYAVQIEREYPALIKEFPFLKDQIVSGNGSQLNMFTPSTGCSLLGMDNHCMAEDRLGRKAKPTVCRLFPFNKFSLLGNTLVVSPHWICPLKVSVPSQHEIVKGSYELLTAELAESGVLNRDMRTFPRPPVCHGIGSDGVLKREREFNEVCSAALTDGLRFSSVNRQLASDEGWYSNRLRRLLSVFALDGEFLDPSIDALLLVVASAHRMDCVDVKSNELLLMLAVLEVSVLSLSRSRVRKVTAKDVWNLWKSLNPLLSLVANCDALSAIQTQERVRVPPWFSAGMYNACFDVSERNSSITVLESLESVVGTLSMDERKTLVMTLGGMVGKSKME